MRIAAPVLAALLLAAPGYGAETAAPAPQTAAGKTPAVKAPAAKPVAKKKPVAKAPAAQAPVSPVAAPSATPVAPAAGASSTAVMEPAPVSATPLQAEPVSATATLESAVPSATMAVESSPAGGDEEEEAPASKWSSIYGFDWAEGVAIPSVAKVSIGTNVGTTLGLRFAADKETSVYGMYEFSYDGPGLRAQEGREFTDRLMDHSAALGYQWSGLPGYRLTARASWMYEMRRSGSNEQFGRGLYDFWTPGFAIDQSFAVAQGIEGLLTLYYGYVLFPNYTDLLKEFQSAAMGAEQAGGQQDYHQLRVAPSINLGGNGQAWFSWGVQSYVEEKVVSVAGTYTDTKQLDQIFEVGAAREQVLFSTEKGGNTTGKMTLSPTLKVTVKTSNQNYLHFKGFGEIPSFVSHYYNYTAPELGLPLRFNYPGGQLFLIPQYTMTYYNSRSPRNAAGDFVREKRQVNQTWMFTTGLGIPAYKFGTWTFGYTAQIQQSNNHFERYLPYNYTSHYLFAALSMKY